MRMFGSALLGLIAMTLVTTAAHAQGKKPLPLKVVGVQVQNSENKRVRLRGVNVASMEWSSDGEGHVLDTVKTAIRDWKVNIVRIPLAQDRWFGKAPEQKDDGKAYRALVKQIVDSCVDSGVYALLDLHWSNAGEWGKQIGQHKMPDENSVALWKSVASEYKNNPGVLFDLYNEPHDTTWEIWRDGGTVTEKNQKEGTEKTYQAVGIQKLLDTVRDTGAKNVVVAGGLDWSYDMTGFTDKPLSDPKGNGVIYANHAYPFKGENVKAWINRMEKATAKVPVIVSEFGSDPGGAGGYTGENWVRAVLQALQEHDWNWTAWDMHPAAGPTLISDWNYKPTAHFGDWVQKALLGTLPPFTSNTPVVPVPVNASAAPATTAQVVYLWPAGSPTLKGANEKEQTLPPDVKDDSWWGLKNIHNPSIEIHLPPADKATGAAMIVAPGGGHEILVWKPEGTKIADWLNSIGVAAIVLKYRLEQTPGYHYTVEGEALQDTQRAVRITRARSKEWGIDPNRVGILGFSAGGALAALADIRFDRGKPDATDPIDRQSCRPDFVALVYPGWKPMDITAPKDAAPAFLTSAGLGDAFHAKQTVEFHNSLFNAGVPSELHIYSNGEHGGAISERKGIPFGTWHIRFQEWLNDRGILKKP